ncbi:sensor histidine kinase [Amycolatopsis acidiphila]|uniref:histidine kinase n=1 Tax=Amycolatopsis acidiphila TaxID=715473 RepID=A0A558A6T7_9PSEU|nr:sensor histidine kinase [Amycolatopsis acidiphila]TVT19970.1 sensor histidine kinase [Amycolatopsis acidiphila]UIJ64141.1 sensor histidine kinase [Amycolatopsis acidiphila]GHG61543.1 two-component sensor histidine kinase [Amycolatopsis acidiphila]
MAGDTLLAALLLLFDLLLLIAAAPASSMKPWYVAVPVDLAMTVPIVFRRRSPMIVAYVVLAVSVVHSSLHLGSASLTASAISLYTLIVYVGRKQAGLYLGAQVICTGVQLALGWEAGNWVIVIIAALVGAFTWVLGEFVGARRAYHAEVEARLHLLETERDQASRIAVAQERGRIARELHDVVAHAVSVIVVQADGASYAVRSNPELAERAVQTISNTGREALAELRRLLEVLRNEDGAGVPRIPQPDAESLAELVERVRQAGVPVRLEIEGTLAGLPAGVSLGVYRIVQESLTNTLKHAGRGARADVRIERGEELVDVVVTDDGAGKARELVPAERQLPGGNGVIGMRERANVYGGSLDVGPAPGGGWRVHARLPIRLAQ